jgi:hypothetical protein
MISTLGGDWAPLTHDNLLSAQKCDISTLIILKAHQYI